MQPPHRRSQVKQRSRLARAVFQGRRNVGGCPARAPPDVNQMETEVTWEEKRVHQACLDLVKSPSLGGMGTMGSALPCPDFPHHQGPSGCQLHRPPVPWIPGCAGSRSRPLVPQPGGGVSPSWGGRSLHRFPLRAARWHQRCHGSNVICKCPLLGFSPFVRVCIPHVLRGSGSEPFTSWGSLAVFLFCGLHLQCNRSFIHFVWGRGWPGTHTLLSPVLGLGSCTPGTRTSWMSPLVPKTSDVAARQPRSLVRSFQLRNSAWLFPQPLSPLGLYCCLSLSERLGHPA